MTTEEDTQVKSISQETGENNVKSVTYKSQGHAKFPNFNDKRYGIKSSRIEQQFQQKEQEASIWSKVIKALPLPLIGYLTALISPKKMEAKNNPDKHTKDIDSKLEKGNVEQVVDKKRVK